MVVDVIPGEGILIDEAGRQPPHKIDENMWKNREYIEETIFLLESSNWPEGVIYDLFLIIVFSPSFQLTFMKVIFLTHATHNIEAFSSLPCT